APEAPGVLAYTAKIVDQPPRGPLGGGFQPVTAKLVPVNWIPIEAGAVATAALAVAALVAVVGCAAASTPEMRMIATALTTWLLRNYGSGMVCRLTGPGAPELFPVRISTSVLSSAARCRTSFRSLMVW